jgi:anti-sigma factor ChrR (cupin superfamily)
VWAMPDTNVQTCESVQASLASFVVGGLSLEEFDHVRQHVSACFNCSSILRNEADLVSAGLLAEIDLNTVPPASLKRRLMNTVREQPNTKPGVLVDHGGLLLVRSGEVPWQKTDFEGLLWRPLIAGPSKDRHMSVFRMKKGCIFPAHEHLGTEELYMLSGTLIVEGTRIGAGDYCRAEHGTFHAPITAITDADFLLSTDGHL